MSLPATISDYSDVISYVYRKYRDHIADMPYRELVDAILRDLSNKKRSHYKEYAKTSLDDRMIIAEQLADILRDHFVRRQKPGYTQKTKGRPLCLPTEKENLAMELVTDYILADDHVKGLRISRDPVIIGESNHEEYPPLGEGARKYLDQYVCRIGFPLSIGEKRDLEKLTVKRCEICDSEFIDRTKPKNAKRCGPTCNEEHERRRLRRFYNGKIHDIAEGRLKRQWRRQQHEYPFYSPQEFQEIARRGEYTTASEKFERGKLAKKLNPEIDFGGKKAVKHKSLSDIESLPYWEKFKQPKHDPRKLDKKYDIEWSPVTTYKLSDMTDEKFVEASEIRRLFS